MLKQKVKVRRKRERNSFTLNEMRWNFIENHPNEKYHHHFLLPHHVSQVGKIISQSYQKTLFLKCETIPARATFRVCLHHYTIAHPMKNDWPREQKNGLSWSGQWPQIYIRRPHLQWHCQRWGTLWRQRAINCARLRLRLSTKYI